MGLVGNPPSLCPHTVAAGCMAPLPRTATTGGVDDPAHVFLAPHPRHAACRNAPESTDWDATRESVRTCRDNESKKTGKRVGRWASEKSTRCRKGRQGGALSSFQPASEGRQVGNLPHTRNRHFAAKSPLMLRQLEWMWLATLPSASFCSLMNSMTKVGPWTR